MNIYLADSDHRSRHWCDMLAPLTAVQNVQITYNGTPESLVNWCDGAYRIDDMEIQPPGVVLLHSSGGFDNRSPEPGRKAAWLAGNGVYGIVIAGAWRERENYGTHLYRREASLPKAVADMTFSECLFRFVSRLVEGGQCDWSLLEPPQDRYDLFELYLLLIAEQAAMGVPLIPKSCRDIIQNRGTVALGRHEFNLAILEQAFTDVPDLLPKTKGIIETSQLLHDWLPYLADWDVEDVLRLREASTIDLGGYVTKIDRSLEFASNLQDLFDPGQLIDRLPMLGGLSVQRKSAFKRIIKERYGCRYNIVRAQCCVNNRAEALKRAISSVIMAWDDVDAVKIVWPEVKQAAECLRDTLRKLPDKVLFT